MHKTHFSNLDLHTVLVDHLIKTKKEHKDSKKHKVQDIESKRNR